MKVNKLADITNEQFDSMLSTLSTLTKHGNCIVLEAVQNVHCEGCVLWQIENIWDNTIVLRSVDWDETCIFQCMDACDVTLRYRSWKTIEEILR